MGFLYFKARYYDPELGRFLSKDVFEGHGNLAASWHSYQYAYNNPLKWVDPSGNFTTGIESTQREQIRNLPELTDRDAMQLINIENKDQYSDYLLDKHLKNDKPLSTYEGDRLETYLNEYGNWAVDTYGQEKGLGLLQGLLTPGATEVV